MKLRLFDKSSVCLMAFGLAVGHVAGCGICAFFAYRFVHSGFDFAWLAPLGIILIPLLFVDIVGSASTAISRWFLRCRVDESGIYCYSPGWRPWFIAWSDIHTYGISGYSSQRQAFALIFLSTDPKEVFDKNKFSAINQHRIIFQACDEIWRGLSGYMPADMKRNLQWSIEHERDCFHKR